MYELMNWPLNLSSVQLSDSPSLNEYKFFTPMSLTNMVNTHQVIQEYFVGAKVV